MDTYRMEFVIPHFIIKDIINYILNDSTYSSFTLKRDEVDKFRCTMAVNSTDKLKLQELSQYVLRKANNTEMPELLNTNIHTHDRMCINCTAYCNKRCTEHNVAVLYYDVCKSFNSKYQGVFTDGKEYFTPQTN